MDELGIDHCRDFGQTGTEDGVVQVAGGFGIIAEPVRLRVL
jgi:hypothetical protein